MIAQIIPQRVHVDNFPTVTVSKEGELRCSAVKCVTVIEERPPIEQCADGKWSDSTLGSLGLFAAMAIREHTR